MEFVLRQPLAWADRGAELRRGVHWESHVTRAKRIEAPDYLELDTAAGRTALLTGGLPYHFRIGQRMLDTLVSVRGASQRRVRLGIGIDVPHAWMAALDWHAPPIVRSETAAPPTPVGYGWLFAVDAKNAVVTHWAPLIAAADPDGAAAGQSPGRVIGIRCRLLEIEGRGGVVNLRCYRTPLSAERTDFENQPTGALVVEGDRVHIDLGAYEWIQAEVRFS